MAKRISPRRTRGPLGPGGGQGLARPRWRDNRRRSEAAAPPDGISLDRLLGQALEPGLFLRVATGLAAALVRLHRQGLIHKDLKPAHVRIVDAAGGAVELTGLGCASRLPRERAAAAPPERLVGTLAYMAPEQTGRMNRSIDARSDLYSLGVSLYEMLTGVLPFTADDPLGWVHCHLARAPLPPAERIPGISPVLSALILKLLAKAPEDRYQTAAGVEADLRRCRQAWERQGVIEPFALGVRDIPDRLMIPEKLYGREREIQALQAAFERVAREGRSEWLLIAGYAGIGKSSVVNELQQWLLPQGALFATGKFDQHQRDVPYATLAQAFDRLIRQLLLKNEAELQPWRRRLQEVLGAHAGLLTELIPALVLVIGPQPPVAELPAQEQQSRFHALFGRFLAAFARPEQPLVLFLDDLQWLDPATLTLMQHLAAQPAPRPRPLLVIGAYRDNEVSPSHPLMLALEAIRKTGLRIGRLALGPLTGEDLCRLLADALHAAPVAVAPLAGLVHEKTGGNPFFAIQFLGLLAEEGLLAFDAAAGAWTWQLEQIHAQRYTDNVVELMIGKLQRLPAAAREALQRLAGLGHRVDGATLAMVQDATQSEIDAALQEAVRAGFVHCHEGSYAFLHDRIQEAAYALIPPGERPALHLDHGRRLLTALAAAALPARVFDVVEQFNRGAALIAEPGEKLRVAELNLVAGRRAKASAAYPSACVYLAAGMTLLPGEQAWSEHYALAYALWLERAECEFLCGHFDRAESLLAQLLLHGRSRIERAAAHHLQIQLHVMRSEHVQAVDCALAGLRLFDIELPAHPTEAQMQEEYEQVWTQLGARPIEGVLDQPMVDDPELTAAMRLLTIMVDAAYFTDHRLFALHLCRTVNLNLRYGPTTAAANAFAWFGWILGPFFHRYREGYRFVTVGRALVERHGLVAFQAEVSLCLQTMAPWTRPLDEAVSAAAITLRRATEAGHLAVACYGWLNDLAARVMRGDALDEVWAASEQALDFCRRTGFEDALQVALLLRRFMTTLRGGAASQDPAFDEAAFEAQLVPESHRWLAGWYWIVKAQTRFLMGEVEAALAAARQARSSLAGTYGVLQGVDYHYYGALALAALYPRAAPAEQQAWHAELLCHEQQLREWAEGYPPNFADKHTLVCAEIARIEGRELDALCLYERAIRAAQDQGFVQYQGVAHELAAGFCRARGLTTAAGAHLQAARRCFARWGAEGKLRRLEARHPELPPRADGPASGGPVQLDLLSVAKASQAISGQILLEELVDALLRIVVENAGAQTAALLLVRDGTLVLAAEATVDLQTVRVHRPATTALEASLPVSLLNYVRRSREPVLLDDAARAHPYAADAYFVRCRPRSVLCLPILRQSALIGLLYLEHQQLAQAFTPERLTVLKLLAGQAAISLENARLYGELQQENHERRQAEAERRLKEEQILENQTRLRLLHEVASVAATGAAAGEVIERSVAALAAAFADLGVCYSTLDEDGRLQVLAQRPLLRGRDGKRADDQAPDGAQLEVRLQHSQTLTGLLSLHAAGAYRWSTHETETLAAVAQQLAVVLSDAEARAQRQRALEALTHQADALFRSKQELERYAYVASHDMREPLRTVCSYVQLIEHRYRGSLDAEGLEYMGFITEAVNRIGLLIEGLLAYSRLERQGGTRVPVDLETVLESTLALLGAGIQNSGALITHGPLPTVSGDPAQLAQLLQNLIDNTLKFRGPLPPAVQLQASRDGDAWRISVRDNGIGIEPQYLERVFVFFQRLHPRDRYPGTGVGLAICKRIVELHGGRIWVESAGPGCGSTFCFTLPEAAPQSL